MHARKTWGFLLLLGLLVLSAATISAQVQSGRIVGVVTDPQHAAIPNATVIVTNTATNIAQTFTTDSNGSYVDTPLDPGTYTVTAVAPGFQKTVRNGIELVVAQIAEVDMELAIGSTSTEVTVSAATPVLSTESGALGTTITNHEVMDLPLNGRDYTKLAALSPGDVNLPATGNTQNVRPEAVNGNVVNGVSGQMTVFLLDGANITEEHEGGTYIQTSIDALGEFNVETNPYSAEYSGPGGTLNATTKSGTNEFHGDLFEFFRNEKLDARNYFTLPQNKEELKRNQFGGVFGGPLSIPKLYSGKDRTFFFVSYEGGRQ
ncbi:MAG TPA: carboxypeptidase-like regulatory domain-containing protein, partial [Candidatus Acidoferrales bacterium]|nr:carboxypeptidase-like regulatory domain-containing protein [Candidatus Acidoferrales bacterium]